MSSMEAGIQMDFSVEQDVNANGPISVKLNCPIVPMFDPDSKIIDDKLEHSEKQYFRMKRTDLGIKIDLSEMQLSKADSPISQSCESASNVSTESEEHP
jgi:hypothetical protein